MKVAVITIPGRPFAWHRPRFNRKTGAVFDDARLTSNKNTVQAIALRHFPQPLAGPVRLSITATFAIPKSRTKRERAALLASLVAPHTQTPDADNLQKSVLDGFNKIVFADDKQVFDVRCQKLWGEVDSTVVVVEAFGMAVPA